MRYYVIRLSFLIVLLSVSTAAQSLAGERDDLRVLDEQVNGVPTGKLLYKYLRDQTRPHFAARKAAVKAVTTPEQFYERQKRLRTDLLRIIGKFPDKTPLNGRTVGKIKRDGYVIENVIYESRPRHHVTANLYLPETIDAPVPGVLVPCGHSKNGKAAGAYQSIAISLAKNGMAVLVYDPIGQGERHQYLDADGKPPIAGTTEHTLEGVNGWLVGLGTAHYRIWDGIRSIDYLSGRPEVDAKRIGCTGNSGGGTMTSYLMAVDHRILAAAPSCYLTTLERLFDTIGPQDAEQNHAGQVALGIDHADYIALRAPKPTLMCVATQDFFDIDGAWTTYQESKRLYGLLGHGERMDIFEYNDKHGFSKPRRQAAMRFLRRWLVGQDDNPDEGELRLSSDAELQCTKTGEVLGDFKDGISVFDLNRKRAEQLKQSRARLWKKSKADALKRVRRLAAIREVKGVPPIEKKGIITVGEQSPYGFGGTIEKLVIRRKGEPPLPALFFSTPYPGDGKRPAVLYVTDSGKAAEAKPDGEITKLLKAGKVVMSIDVRGVGETAAGDSRSGYFGSDFKTALLALHLNRPLLGQQTEDVLAAVNYLATRDDDGKVEIVGVGQCGPVALHAAAFEKRIKQITLVRSINSWNDVVNEPLARNQLVNVVPFALETYDLPDLIRSMAPRKVIIKDAVDPRGKVIEK